MDRAHALERSTGGRWLHCPRPDTPVRHLLTDSRQLHAPADTVFFAIRGPHLDGHDYLDQVVAAGVRTVVVTDPAVDRSAWDDVNVLLVQDAVRALQCVAAERRAAFDGPVVGITGSNGKTIVKEWLHQVVHGDLRTVRNPRSYNSQIGVPLSVWRLAPHHDVGIFEAGISQPGEMEHLAPIIRPTIGIFTHIGSAHAEHFADQAQIVREKMRLFERADVLVVRLDQDVLRHEVLRWAESHPGVRLMSWTTDGHPDAAVHVRVKDDRVTIDGASVRLPFTDDASVENIVHVVLAARALGVAPASIEQGVAHLRRVSMRLEQISGVRNCSLINDSYNSDIDSLSIALHFLARQEDKRPRTLILSDILQSGLAPDELVARVVELCERFDIRRFIGIGPVLHAHSNAFRSIPHVHGAPSTDAFLNTFRLSDLRDEAILLKGARDFAFERIAARLEERVHATRLEVDLEALAHNLKVFRSMIGPSVRTMAMVKAFGYGAGGAEVARMLAFHRVDWLGVAYIDEGVALRDAGVELPILVLNPDWDALDVLLRYDLEAEIVSHRALDDVVRRLDAINPATPLGVHVNIDTGMHRLGIAPEDASRVGGILARSEHVVVRTVFSHLAGSDDPAQDVFTRQQIETFRAASDAVQAMLGHPVLRHLTNTHGIDRFPEARFDMVRLGIGLYGSHATLSSRLRPVARLVTTIARIQRIAPGETVGYGRSWTADRPTRVATLSIGYADGLDRRLSNGRGHVWIHGRLVPVIGTVCMDMTMVDVTDIPDARAGDEVEVFGPNRPLADLAREMETITYEVITRIPERVKRVFYSD